MQHYLRPDVLRATGAEQVTAWGQQFTKSETTLKPRMTGDGFEQVTRIGKYVNVPELMRVNAAFTDTVLRDQLETALPEVVGGDRQLLRRDPSPQVQNYIGELSHRIDNLSASNGTDNMLSITGDGRRVALDGRLVGLDADDDGGRSQAVVDQIVDVHQRTQHRQFVTETGEVSETPGGLQIVFLDQSTPRDQWNMYDQMKDDLVAAGMDGDAIRFIHEADTDEARDSLFTACRNGEVSVMLGSTQKMGTGTNVQARAVALHHVDCPWRPADLEQREGRIIRQGNQNAQVEIYSYATDKTFDVASWDMIARKAKFIGQMKRGELAGRQMEDVVAGLEFSASRAASELSGDPRIQELAELNLRVEQLESLQQTWQSERSKTRVMLRHNDHRVQYLADNMPALQGLADRVVETAGERFQFEPVNGSVMTDRADAGAYVGNALRQQALRTDLPHYQQPTDMTPVGTLGGMPLGVMRHGKSVQLVVADMPSIRREWAVPKLISDDPSALGTIRSAENLVAGLSGEYATWQQEHAQLTQSRAALAEVLDAPFEYGDELRRLQTQAQDLAAEMGLADEDTAEQQAAPTVSGQTLTDVFGDRGSTVYRDNDVVSYQRAYYRLGFVYDDQGRFQDMYGYLADEQRPENLVEDGEVLYDYLPMTVIQRDWSQLTAMQQTVLQRDTNYDVHYRHTFELDDGDRVQFVTREDPKTVLEGTLHNRVFSTDDGQRYGQADVNQSAGFVSMNKTSPEAQQVEANERLALSQRRSANQLVPGEILQEDVDGFGYTGDMIRSYSMGYGRGHSTFAVSPDTGKARVMDFDQRPSYRGRQWDTRPATMLSDAEKHAVFGGHHLDTEVGQLRPGDRVMSADIDDHAAVKETVTVLEMSGVDRKELTYRGSDDVLHTSSKMDSTTIRVHDRAKGALTGHELLYLNGQSQQHEPVAAAEFADTAYPGQHVFVEVDRYQPWNQAGFSGSVPATVVEVREAESEYATDEIVVDTQDGDRMNFHVHHSDFALTPTDQPVQLSQLVDTAQAHTESAPVADNTAPSVKSVVGGQHQRRVQLDGAASTEQDAPGQPNQQRERQRESADWFKQHVQVMHVGGNDPSPGLMS